jgi:hypothetical protein
MRQLPVLYKVGLLIFFDGKEKAVKEQKINKRLVKRRDRTFAYVASLCRTGSVWQNNLFIKAAILFCVKTQTEIIKI